MKQFRLEFPPTVNHYWRSYKGIVCLSDAGKAYRFAAAEFGGGDPIRGPVGIFLRVTFPDRRKRDLDNLLKAILDAISHAGIWEDDAQVELLLVQRRGVERPGWVEVWIVPMEERESG